MILSSVPAPRRLVLASALSPGDLCTLTVAIESLHANYPGRFLTDVRTSCDELFRYNPRITPLAESDAEFMQMHYTDLVNSSNGVSNAFLRGYCFDLCKKLNVFLELTTNRPHLYLSDDEKTRGPLRRLGSEIPEKFWLVAAGVKRDLTVKQWPVEFFQEVVDYFRGKITFVQIGSSEHSHPSLDGVVNLLGRTDIRQLMCLAYHAQAGLGPITLLQHLCAAFEKPYVALLGGREPVTWTQYPLQTTLHTLGKLPCCRTNACWRSRVIALNDGSEQDDSLCDLPIMAMQRPVSKCMWLIKPVDVIRAMEVCYEGGALTYSGT